MGVDLIELRKARSFYNEHKERLGHFFSPVELAYIRKRRPAYEGLASVWAAKEAAFKTIAGPGAGLWELRDVRVRPDAKRRDLFRAGRSHKIAIKLVRNRRYVVAECVGNC